MLLQLPKDILTFILSIVVDDVFQQQYSSAEETIPERIKSLCGRGGRFDCESWVSSMARFMVQLSHVHPLIRQLLRHGCQWHVGKEKEWIFLPCFFHAYGQSTLAGQ